MEFFLGNPFSTPVGQLIENATSSSLPSEDWGLNMDICDIVNETDDGAKDAVRAIKKRILGNRNFKEVMLTLSVLEACVKNCGHKFHTYVSTRDFVENVMVQTIVPKNNPPLILQERVLTMIQAWSDAFRSSPDLTGVVTVYEDLRRKGVQFPINQSNGCSPIQTPNRTIESMYSERRTVTASQPQSTETKLEMSPQQLKRDLEMVRNNLSVMSGMMSRMGSVRQSDMEQLQQLYVTCKNMQGRILELIPSVTDEKLIGQLLIVNDNMNTTFAQYHSFEKNLKPQSNVQSSTTKANVIDFGATPNQLIAGNTPQSVVSQSTVKMLSNQMAGLSTKTEVFTQNKSSTLQRSPENLVAYDGLTANPRKQQDTSTDDNVDSTALGSSPQFHWMIEKGMIPVDQIDMMEDIEQWLNVDVDDSEGVTSEEFDKFLAARAKAAESLPSVNESLHNPDCSQL
ncbi:target of Myb protein 1 isoform X1 [Triplophysa rosa]|uniref:Tom1 protein n=1 Tax=Triplophysa rosa TaxID=992332 RepID=A0A9W7TVH0_TRIRA|nr:target of Myb protein 1 isoform X1 [Triplophysa rosa]KAI7803062.1 Tom1 protein [Triplophysa rosa]